MRFIIVNNKSGQGLLEMVVAIGVISVGLFSVWSLFISNYNGEQEANARILAVNLAREGVEIVKNIRDTNWLHIENNESCSYNGSLSNPCRWDSGISGGSAGILRNMFREGVYLEYAGISSLDDSITRLYTDADDDLYSHENEVGDKSTRYRRMIEFKNICCNDVDANLQCDDLSIDFTVRSSNCFLSELKVGISVASHVRWTIENKNRELTIYNRIFNWK